MSQLTRYSKRTWLDVASLPSPITKIPPEIMSEIFKFVVLSSKKRRSSGVKALCLVDKRWNDIANTTPDLWTKVTLAFPFHADKFFAVQKWLKASEPKDIDVEIDLRDPDWDEPVEEIWFPSTDSLRGVIAVLRGSEHRWRSIRVDFLAWDLTQKLIGAWITPSFPALESISLERTIIPYSGFSSQQNIELPALLGGGGTLMPKLRKVALYEMPLDWTPAAATSFQNLRKIVISGRTFDAGPTLDRFSEALLVASLRLEILEVGGHFPIPGDSHTQTQIPLVHLPALKRFVFGWPFANLACSFLAMLQIPETLETLCLAQEHKPLGGGAGLIDPSPVFDLLTDLASEGSGDKNPSTPWISTLGLKSLSMTGVRLDPRKVTTFLQNAPVIEEIHLKDIKQPVLEATATLAGTRRLRFLKRLGIRWEWRGRDGSEGAHLVAECLRDPRWQVVVRKYARTNGIELDAQVNEEDAERAS